MSRDDEGAAERGLGLVLALYPASFRERFAEEWKEVVSWRRERLRGSAFGRARFGLYLLADTLRAVPIAYARSFLAPRRRAARARQVASGGAVGGGGRGPRAWREAVTHDARQAVRGLARSPLFTVAAVASIALGVGANTAIFSVVNGVLLRPLPYEEPERLTIVWNEFSVSGLTRLPLSGPGVEELRNEPGIFDAVGGVWATTRTVADDQQPTQVSAGLVTHDFFDVLGVEPALGRTFDHDRTQGFEPRGVVISHALWQGYFAGDPTVIGRAVRIDGQPVPVIGVLAPDFTLHFPPDGSIPPTLDAYVPLPFDLSNLPAGQHFIRVVARLRGGVDMDEARAGVARASERARQTYPELQTTGDFFSVQGLQEDAVRAARPVLLSLLVGVGLFLLLAAANVGNLFMARASTRGRELAVRASLGASRARLAQLVAMESALIALVGGAVGLWAGTLGGELLWSARPEGVARVDGLVVDGSVFAYAIGSAGLAALVFGLAPLLSLTRLAPVASLRVSGVGGDGGAGARQALTAAEVALGLVLLVGAGLVGQTLVRLQSVDPGFRADGVVTFRLALPTGRFPTDGERTELAYELERRLGELPGVEAVGATSHLPLARWANWGDASPPDGTPEHEREQFFADLRSVTPGYLEALGAELVSGRWLEESDVESGQPVVVIDRSFARRAFPEGDPVGRVLHPSRYIGGAFVRVPALVVGLVEDVRDVSLARPSAGQIFWPYAQSARWELTYLVRGRAELGEMAAAIERVVPAVHADLVPARVLPLEVYLKAATAEARFIALLGAIFSGLALVLAAIGLYGVVSFVTVRRLREFGLRLVLGAHPRVLVRGVLRDGTRLAALGVLAGIGLSLLLARFLDALLFGVSPHDPVTIAVVAALLLGIAVLASVVPALRAARADPMSVLRAD